MIKEFKEFALKGSFLDLENGMIHGLALGAIVNPFVNDILMPPIGALLGKVDFSNLFINLSGRPFPSYAAAKAAGAPAIGYGTFLNAVINFLIVAFILFLIVKQVNRMRGPAPGTKD